MNIIVSVVVITYNSSDTIVETLDSIRCQTYRENIELIISDDCSTDSTVRVVLQWLDKYDSEFHSSVLLQASSNKGIVGNLNRSVQEATGFYLKFIAGDDAFYNKYSIARCVELCEGFSAIFTPVQCFTNNESDSRVVSPSRFSEFMISSDDDKKIAHITSSSSAPKIVGFFSTRKLVNDLGCFDQDYPMMEDYPFIVKLLINYDVNDIRYINEVLFKYRVRVNITRDFIVSDRKRLHTKSLNKFRRREVMPYLFNRNKYFAVFKTQINILLLELETSSVVGARFVRYMIKLKAMATEIRVFK